MVTYQHSIPKLSGIVELDEKYIGGKPRYQHGVKHKRGRGTAKSCVATSVQRQGPVKEAPVVNDSLKKIKPFVEQRVSSQAHLMTDEYSVYRLLAPGFADHQAVSHGKKEFARGPVHNNMAESFQAKLERALQGVYHYMSKRHLSLYATEAAFRWNQRRPVEKTLTATTRAKNVTLWSDCRSWINLQTCCVMQQGLNSGDLQMAGSTSIQTRCLCLGYRSALL